ncbi:antibiotic biosynthesis monooxygenase family protein [Amycolatopsis thailandensis]|uniref:antibiotic biosynthesis monooxygenase family protein n=1 Tax=Amycolatopsis thailandensis TaxID=589330 RepID=UPI00365EF497
MTVGFVATHYPHADHHDEFVARVRRVAGVLSSTPGCLGAECWVTAAGDAVVSIARWESAAAQAASMQALGSADVDVAFDDREVRPREIVQLVSA